MAKKLNELQAFVNFVIKRNSSNKTALKKKLPRLPHFITTIIDESAKFGDEGADCFEKGWKLGANNPNNPKPLYNAYFPYKTYGAVVCYYSADPIEGIPKLFPRLWKQFTIEWVMAA